MSQKLSERARVIESLLRHQITFTCTRVNESGMAWCEEIHVPATQFIGPVSLKCLAKEGFELSKQGHFRLRFGY